MARSRMVEQIGRVVGGRYRLLAPIGTGASADVFVADDVTLRRRVAVKVLHAALADDEGFLRRFRAEAQTVGALRHPNIMAVYDWGEDDDGPYLVLEYLGGGSLRDLMDRGHRLTPSQALMVGLETARALDYAHRRGLVHRDIKPANLLFDEEGRVCVADFGIARALAEATWTEPTGAVVGTVRYASPEQARGGTLDGKADVYGLALVLVESVTGQVPFAADTTIATLMGRLEHPIEPPEALGPLVGVIAAAGTIAAADRLDAAAFARGLDNAARLLPRPAPLPLAPSELLADHTVSVQSDPTQLAGRGGGVAVVGGAAGALGGPEPDATAVFSPSYFGPPDPGSRAATATSVTPATAIVPPGVGDLAVSPPPPPLPPGAASARRRRRRWPVVIPLLVIALAGAAAGGVLAARRLTASATYPVPSLLTLSPAEAQTAANVHQWRLDVRHTRKDGSTSGQIVEQSPAPDAPTAKHHLKAGAVLTVYVSDGNTLVDGGVPDLSKLAQADATKKLTAASLALGSVSTTFSDTIAAGSVVSSQPAPGTVAPKGTKVNLVISAGPQPVHVGSTLVGMKYDDAKAMLDGLGLASTRVDANDDTILPGFVISTDPPTPGDIDKTKAITITVSKGPAMVAVPDMFNLPLDQATKKLTDAGLKRGRVFGPVDGTTVYTTRPKVGASVPHGSAVDLYLY